ncbi:MAG: 16S rRNA (uracil(1498)-N(3))-methyltransferase, partial [Rhodospirillaceae bacterium]|nr:16S rRNA (uracil(1498)-N(3))-methyltransferase [Rhodospirillaceae bacterium]
MRLHVDGPLATGGALRLTAAQAHYLGKVMRLKPGDSLSLFNGRDGEWRATLTGLQRGAGTLAVETLTRPQTAEAGPVLVFALLKSARNALLIEKSVELGVAALQPVTTAHGQTRRINLERCRAQAIEAAEQCGRLSLPELHPLVSLPRLLADWPAERPLMFCDETGGSPALEALGAAPAAPAA